MNSEILSDIFIVDKNTEDIEQELKNICKGFVLRWAIVDVYSDKLRVSCSYKLH